MPAKKKVAKKKAAPKKKKVVKKRKRQTFQRNKKFANFSEFFVCFIFQQLLYFELRNINFPVILNLTRDQNDNIFKIHQSFVRNLNRYFLTCIKDKKYFIDSPVSYKNE